MLTGVEMLDEGKVYGFIIISSVCVCAQVLLCLVYVALVAVTLPECHAQQKTDRNEHWDGIARSG